MLRWVGSCWRRNPDEKSEMEDNQVVLPDLDQLSLGLLEAGDEYESDSGSEAGLETASEEDDDDEDESSIRPLCRQVSPLPSLRSSGAPAHGPLPHLCLSCRRPASSLHSLVTCGACRMAEYCDGACQGEHRNVHRRSCGQVKILLRRLLVGPLERR